MPSAKKKAALGAAWKILTVSLFALTPKNLRGHKRRTYISNSTPRARSGTFARRDILPFCSLRPMPITVVAAREIATAGPKHSLMGCWGPQYLLCDAPLSSVRARAWPSLLGPSTKRSHGCCSLPRSKSGRLRRVFSKACCRRHLLTSAWFPLTRVSGTLHPR